MLEQAQFRRSILRAIRGDKPRFAVTSMATRIILLLGLSLIFRACIASLDLQYPTSPVHALDRFVLANQTRWLNVSCHGEQERMLGHRFCFSLKNWTLSDPPSLAQSDPFHGLRHPKDWRPWNEMFQIEELQAKDQKDFVLMTKHPLLLNATNDEPLAGKVIFVGAVSGRLDALRKLLIKAKFDPYHHNHHVVLLGNVLSAHPFANNSGTVDLAIRIGAHAVHGEVERRFLDLQLDTFKFALQSWVESMSKRENTPEARQQCLNNFKRPMPQRKRDDPPTEIEIKVLEAGNWSRDEFFAVNDAPSKIGVQESVWATGRPGVVGIEVPGLGFVHGVHAALVPGLAVEDHEWNATFLMTGVEKSEDGWKAAMDGGEPWQKRWSEVQQSLEHDEDRMTVVSGKDVGFEVESEAYAFNLGTGCEAGGHLSALTFSWDVDNHGFLEKTRKEIVQVSCEEEMNR